MTPSLLRRREPKLAARALVRLLRRLAPIREHVVVTGYPDTEGNAVETVRRLLEHTDAPVVWLVSELTPAGAERVLELTPPPGRLRVLGKRSASGFAAYLTARLTFFTHGLYLSPEPPHRKPVVNLWHGDGPKAGLRDPHNLPPRASWIVSGARVFGERKASFLGVPPDRLLVTGNPRWDQLRRPATDDELRELGLDPGRPIVLFMPTFRSSIAVGARAGWSDAAGTSTRWSSTDMLAGLAAGAAPRGAQVVVKPHPLDAEEYAVDGATCLTNRQLDAAGVALYRLLGRATALVTDYSSVWTDFLVLDRPIGFALADLDDYAGGRGLNVDDLESLLPGPQLVTPGDCTDFVSDALDGAPALAALRATSSARVGLAPVAGSAAGRLLDELAAHGVVVPTG
ncbi:CDP-glycerol glycerophosphotransferase family protein [Nocardioides ferulae]|uniref:CDP-glycerol glycerophosphotransferase family protein n=1 Tax=Nocardioides ferulae TaxID=2340821 RepID=UPI0013DDA7F8|nr:CDP-glycerol glycerophosphotransferase family protein [Nocardioides ferulae]